MFPRWFYWAAAGMVAAMQLNNWAVARAGPMVKNDRAFVCYLGALAISTGIFVHLMLAAFHQTRGNCTLEGKQFHLAWAITLGYVWVFVLSYNLLYDFYRSDLTLPLGCWNFVPLCVVAGLLARKFAK